MTKKSKSFSKILSELRSIAIAIARDKSMKVRYDEEQPTSAFNMETNMITLSLKPYPDYVKNQPIVFRKVLDGDLAHECGHLILTKPLYSYFNNWVTGIKRKRGFYKLAHEICNIVEDKRINHFIILRYRFDIGKRLLLANLILEDMINNNTELKAVMKGNLATNSETQWTIPSGEQDGVYIMGILCNQGLYNAKCTEYWNKMSDEAKEDAKKALQILEDAKYKRLRIDIIRACNEIYTLVAKHLKSDYMEMTLQCARRGGKVKGEISEELRQKLNIEAEKESVKDEADEQKKDLSRGAGAGEGTGEEIPAPEPNFVHYGELLDICKPEIAALLNRLKKELKPIYQLQPFQKRGRMMSPIIPRIYANSFRSNVKNVFITSNVSFEKEQVAIQFLFDYSGSVDRDTAEQITTVLNEVFGHYVDDSSYSITCFGADTQRIKTFFESFDNTKARVGNVTVNSGGTEVSVGMEASLKMFNAITSERRKILVIASDFCFGDEAKALELLEQYAKCGIEIIFIGFSSCRRVNDFASDIPKLKVKRTSIEDISELPQAFLSVYLNVQTK